jgi:ubiquinone/menaquinone biosynthesis C-methylase UbiE
MRSSPCSVGRHSAFTGWGDETMSDASHQELILDQFTRQATPFSTANTITDAHALRMIISAAVPKPGDTVLDVACGGGIIVCAFAPEVKHATGIDMTPAMLDRARQLAAEKGIANVSWDRGDVGSLPYANGTFDIVVTRFSMHHFLDPNGVLREMVRVCRPGGRVLVVDMYASDDPAKAAEWNRLEKLRDPSHVRCLALPELTGLFGTAGLSEPQASYYELRDEVRNLLRRSFPNPGDDVKIIEMFAASAEDDRLGIPVQRDGSRINYAYRVAILAAKRD